MESQDNNTEETKTLRDKTMDEILEIAKRVEKEVKPENFKAVFDTLIKYAYPQYI